MSVFILTWVHMMPLISEWVVRTQNQNLLLTFSCHMVLVLLHSVTLWPLVSLPLQTAAERQTPVQYFWFQTVCTLCSHVNLWYEVATTFRAFQINARDRCSGVSSSQDPAGLAATNIYDSPGIIFRRTLRHLHTQHSCCATSSDPRNQVRAAGTPRSSSLNWYCDWSVLQFIINCSIMREQYVILWLKSESSPGRCCMLSFAN